jgi:hypothetical protein
LIAYFAGKLADSEVFHADPRRDLIVHDAVDDGGDDAQYGDFQ